MKIYGLTMYRSLTNLQAIMATIRELILVYLLFITIFFIGRIVLFVLYYDRIIEAGVNHWFGFLLGLQMDTIVVSIILIVPVLLLFATPKVFERPVRLFIRVYLLLFLLVSVYIENATFPFVAEYDVRPNEIFINYTRKRCSAISGPHTNWNCLSPLP
jgi:hypothetical protein